MAGSSVTFAQKPKETKASTKVTSSSWKKQSRTSVFDRLGSPAATTVQRTVTQEQPFRAGAGRGARHGPYPDQRSKTKKTSSASSAGRCWRGPGGGSPGGLCPTVEESTGHHPGHRHCRGRGGHHFPSKTSAHPSVHQLPDQKQPARPPAGRECLAVEGGHRAGHQRDIPRILKPTVSGPQEDGRSLSGDRPFHSQPPHGSSTLQDGDASIRPFSHQKSRVDSVHRHPRRLSTCPDAPSRPEVSVICGQQIRPPIHLSTLWIGNIREFIKLLRPVVTLLRQRGVKLHVYLDDWLIRADSPEQAQPHAQTTISVLQVRTSSSLGCSSTLYNSQWLPYWRCVSMSSPFTNTGWPIQTSQPVICTDYWACWCSWLHWYNMERLRPVFAKWGEPQIDLSATFANRRLIKFVSPYPDPRAEWTNAMSVPWDNWRGLLYAFPPFKMVPQVLLKITQSPGVRVILNTPL